MKSKNQAGCWPDRPLPGARVRTDIKRFALWLIALHVLALGSGPAGLAAAADRSTPGLQRLVDELRDRLGIPEAVAVSIVTANPKMVSVTPPRNHGLPFTLAIEAGFLDELSDDELAAAIAHELGHVWISTHHPFLQTERLANDVAMRIVARDSLERVYTKMWSRIGASVDMTTFLGPTVVASSY